MIRLIVIIVLLVLSFFGGFQVSSRRFDTKNSDLVTEIKRFTADVAQPQIKSEGLKSGNDKAKQGSGKSIGVLTIEIRQSSFTLNPLEYLKNRMNVVKIQIAVHPTLYDSVIAI